MRLMRSVGHRPRTTNERKQKINMKIRSNRNNCIWTACIAAVALCITMTTAYPAGQNLGTGYISNVTGANGACAVNTQTGQGHKWDIQAGGTYTITLSGVTDCASQGNENVIGVIVHNSTGGNIGQSPNPIYATLVDANVPGVYRFTITLTTQCLTMPIEYCTVNGQPGTGIFAQGYDGTAGDGFLGHLRTATFGDNCTVTGEDTSCQGGCAGASITACKYYDFNASGTKDPSEQLLGWPFCLTSVTDTSFSPVSATSSDGSCVTFSNLPAGTYVVTEGSANGWFGSTNSSTITIDHCGQTVQVDFGNYCTIPSGGFTLGYWSNRNGQAVLQANDPAWRTLLNGLCLRNATGGTYTVPSGSFSTAYANFRTWLLGATATNMAYMLSAQLAALELDVNYKGVLPGSYDLCFGDTIANLMNSAKTSLCNNGYTPSGNQFRPVQDMMKSCIDAINNNGPVVPVTPCDHAGASVSCGQ
jgi:hypothetical protein